MFSCALARWDMERVDRMRWGQDSEFCLVGFLEEPMTLRYFYFWHADSLTLAQVFIAMLSFHFHTMLAARQNIQNFEDRTSAVEADSLPASFFCFNQRAGNSSRSCPLQGRTRTRLPGGFGKTPPENGVLA